MGNRRGTVTIYRFNHFYHLSVCLVNKSVLDCEIIPVSEKNLCPSINTKGIVGYLKDS